MANIDNAVKKITESDYIKNGWLNNEAKNLLLNDADKKIIRCIERAVKPNSLLAEEKIRLIFKSLSLFPAEETKIAIMGQAPYPDKERAGGLVFAFGSGNTQDFMSKISNVSVLYQGEAFFEEWDINAEQFAKENKILLLNSSLTFESATAAQKHKDIWDPFVSIILSNLINLKKEGKDGEPSTFLWNKHKQNIIFQKIM